MELNHVSDISRTVDRQLRVGSPPGPEQTRKLHRAMTALAEDCIEIGQTQTAADILAYILCQIDADSVTLERANELFAELESRVCPRVILDACEFAAGMDLTTMLEYLLDVVPRERN